MTDQPPQSLLSEAAEQAGDAAGQFIDDLQRFAEHDADALAARRYGLPELATAPVRLFAVLVDNAVRAVSTVSDNLALLAENGRFASPTASCAVRVYVGDPSLPAGAKLLPSDLVGVVSGYRIPADGITIEKDELVDDVFTVVAQIGPAPSDTYAGTLRSDDAQTTVQVDYLLAIDEIGVVVT